MATGTATIEVLYFARIAEDVGVRQETLPLTEPMTVDRWLASLRLRHPALASAEGLKIAVNQEYARSSALIRPGDEVALFEPVTGG